MTRYRLFLILASTGVLSACAPMIPELVSARAAYQEASTGPAATLVPADLHLAELALGEAEVAYADDPRGYRAKDLAYVAERKAQLADALAAQATAEKNKSAADAQYQTAQDGIMRDTKAELGATRSDLAATQVDAATTRAQLTASETARMKAEAQAADAMDALTRLSAVKEESRGLVITLSGSVLFRSDEAVLLPAAQARLGQVADALMANKERTILVEGHTDSQGSDAHNLDLSQRRAEAVRSYLTQRGYNSSLVRAVGIGETRPIADNTTDEGRANNRRVELVIERSKSTASQ